MTSYGVVGLGRVGAQLRSQLTEAGNHVLWISRESRSGALAEGSNRMDEIRTCDVVIECTPEDHETKVSVLASLVDSDAAVLTTTSSFTVAGLASASGLGTSLGGFHYLPSYGGELVELVTAHADAKVRRAAQDLAATLGLATIEVSDVPGRVSRRLLVPFLENVLRAVDLEIGAEDDIDRVVQLGLGHTTGPLHRVHAAGIEDHRAAAAILMTEDLPT